MSRVTYARVVLLTYPVAIFIAVTASIMGFLFMLPFGLHMDTSALGQLLPGAALEHIWAAIYFVGGVFVLYGFFFRRPQYESSGLVLLAFALGMQAYAVITIRGIEPGLVAGACLGGTAIGCAFRSYVIVSRKAPWLVTNAPG